MLDGSWRLSNKAWVQNTQKKRNRVEKIKPIIVCNPYVLEFLGLNLNDDLAYAIA